MGVSMVWQNKKLKNITTKIGSGATPNGGQSSYKKDGTPLIRSLNVYDLSFERNDLAFIDDDQAGQLANVEVKEGDVLLNITGASVCRCTAVPNDLVPARVNQHVSIIRADRINLDGKYLKYVLVSFPYKKQLLGLARTGATREALTKTDIEEFEINLPSLEVQTGIASVLSTYDDLIEVNEKRIKILEEIAQRLYTEWFVKFKFPGHEKVRMVDSGTEYGLIPEGWEVKRLGDFTNITMGQSPISEHYNQDKVGFPFHQGVADFGNLYPMDRVYSTHGNKFAEKDDLLFSVRAPVGRINISNKKIILGRGLCAIQHINSLQVLLFLMFTQRFTEKDMIGNGAIYKSVNKNEIEGLKFLCATDKLATSFEEMVKFYYEEIERLTLLDENLQKTRDLLIPKLVNGKRELKYL